MDAAVLTRYETFARPEALRWKDWIAGQLEKVTSGLDALESRAADFGDRVDLGTIAFGCMLGYLDFRFSVARLARRASECRRVVRAVWRARFDGGDPTRIGAPHPIPEIGNAAARRDIQWP